MLLSMEDAGIQYDCHWRRAGCPLVLTNRSDSVCAAATGHSRRPIHHHLATATTAAVAQ